MTTQKLFFIGLLIFALSSCNKDENKIPIADIDCTPVTYSAVIQPLISTNCNSAGCHGANSGNGDFTTYEKLKVFVDEGSVRNRVLDTQDMPRGRDLTSEQLGELQCWLDDGAPDN